MNTQLTAQPLKTAVFLALQAVALLLVAVAYGHSVRQERTTSALPRMRRTPLHVAPTYNYPWMVSDEQLTRVLTKLRPQLRGPKPKINDVDHALRFWGPTVTFDDPACLSGGEMRALLTDHSMFAAAWGPEEPALLSADRGGVGVRTQEGKATASHVDHTLGGLAEIGTPLDFVLKTPTGPATVGQLVAHSLHTFSLNQVEYEWSTLAYALYLPPVRSWRTSEGQEVTFDRLAERLMRQGLSQGVCFGNHRLHALVMLLRVDSETPILSGAMRKQVLAHLEGATRHLIATQNEAGYWNGSWPGDVASKEYDSEADRLLATGHALEWLALAPEEVHPPREVLIRAAQWLCRTIDNLSDSTVRDDYTFLTHAGHALALWRGQEPADFLAAHRPATAATGQHQDKP